MSRSGKSVFCGLLLCLLVPTVVFATPRPEEKAALLAGLSSCGSVLHFDDNYAYLGFGSDYPRATSGRVQVVEIAHPEHQFELTTRDGVVDVASMGDRLFVLTFSGLEEWSVATRQFVAVYPTYDFGSAV